MDNAFSKALRAWAATFTLFSLCACSYVDEVESLLPSTSGEASAENSITLRIPAFKTQTIASVTSIDLYQFSEGVFVKKVTVDSSKDNVVELAKKPGMKVYAMAGYTVENAQLMSENDFSKMTIPVPKDSCSAPAFFSSVTKLVTEDNIDIELQRGVARLDIDNGDPELKIEKISISGAASCSHIFQTDGRICESESANYCRTFEDGIEGFEERAFVLFETSSPITVTVSGRRNGEAVEIVSETPAIVRSTIYTVCIHQDRLHGSKERAYSDSNGDSSETDLPTAIIQIRDWEEGDVESGSIDLGETAIDIERSYIPKGVTINSAYNTVTVPADGVNGMRLAFVTRSTIHLGSVVSETEGVSVTPLSPIAINEGYVSEFMIDVAKQPKCGAHYTATVFFNGSSSFFVNINVEPSPFQIPTVHIGGHDWMCFNAVSQDPDEQIFLPHGMTVEKMYHDNFEYCIGNFFQYGRPNPFSPWKAYDPTMFADQKRDMPWETQSMMPLPKGFHVPSIEEWKDLIPEGTVIPASYRTPSGDSIHAMIITVDGTLDGTPSAATNAQNYLKRGVLFESVTTGARLFLPMGGIKTNTSAEIPTDPKFRFDTKSGYWMKEDRNVMFLEFGKLGDGSDGIHFERDRWYADGFVMLRGIKD